MAELVGNPLAPFSPRLEEIAPNQPYTLASPEEMNARYQIILDGLARLHADQGALSNNFQAHISATSVHSATSEPTPNRIALRDSAGRTKFAKPVDDLHAARKVDIDDLRNILYTKTDLNTPGGTGQVHWDRIIGRPSRFEVIAHEHDTGDLTSGTLPVKRGGTGRNDLTSGRYLVGAGTDSVALKTTAEVLTDIGAAAVNHTHTWAQITGKPATFPPSSHTHPASDITSGTFPVARGGTGRSTLTSGRYLRGNATGAVDLVTATQVRTDIGAAAVNHSHSWSQITSKPSTFPPSSHTHSASQIVSGTLSRARISVGAAHNTQVAPGQGGPGATTTVGSLRLLHVSAGSSTINAGDSLSTNHGLTLATMSPVTTTVGSGTLIIASSSYSVPGTWQALSSSRSARERIVLAVRIS